MRPSITTYPPLIQYLENLQIRGQLSSSFFSNLSSLQSLRLMGNLFSGNLDMGTDFSSRLEFVDLRYNNISSVTVGLYSKTLLLKGNPLCDQQKQLCETLHPDPVPEYSTARIACPPYPPCSLDGEWSLNCVCSHPYKGTLQFRSPLFSDFGNVSHYKSLESQLQRFFLDFQLPVESIALYNLSMDTNNNLYIGLKVFPSGKPYFNQSDVSSIGYLFSSQYFHDKYQPPEFGPFVFNGASYPFQSLPSPPSPAPAPNNLGLIIGASVGGVVFLTVVVVLVIIAIRKPRRRREDRSRSFGLSELQSTSSIPSLSGVKMFTFDEIKKYTNNFSDTNDIGDGGYGKVYRGVLPTGQLVAIKRAQHGSAQGEYEFRTEIELLTRVHHKNLVKLIGFCFEQGEQMLIYEYVPNGTLRDSLAGRSGVRLDWKKRLRVALGAAKGIAYLHELVNPPIVHRDIKSSNILLDDRLNAKVSDFGLSKILGEDGKGQVTTQVKGTMGYLDPEYYMTQQLTEKSDVYSFGVLLLEIISARKPLEKGRYIVREVNELIDRSRDLYGLQELLDPTLGLGTSLGGFEKYVDLALRCVEESKDDRPSMSEVVGEIEKIMIAAGLNPALDSAATSRSYSNTSRSPRHPYNFDVQYDRSET